VVKQVRGVGQDTPAQHKMYMYVWLGWSGAVRYIRVPTGTIEAAKHRPLHLHLSWRRV